MDLAPGRVTGREMRLNRDGDHPVMMLQVVMTDARDVRAVELVTQHGQKSSPPNGSKVAVASIGRSWKVALGCDDKLLPNVNPGESRYYSTDESGGAIVAQIYFKNDGTMVVDADTAVEVQAPQVSVQADIVEIQAQQGTITVPTLNIVGNAIVTGNLGVAGSLYTAPGGAGGGATITGNIEATGDVVAGAVSLQGHHHSNPEGGFVGDAF